MNRLGDRKDGKLLRDLDSLHFITPIIYPNRCDNEAFISEQIDLTRTNEYLDKKNAENPEYRYNLFQVVVAALLKTVTLRPKMNRFIANSNVYQRNDVSAAFVVKKQFADNGAEALAFIHTNGSDTIDSIHNELFRQITHKTPMEYVLFYRIEQACILLTTTNLPITEISFRCGFNDSGYFARRFKMQTGVSPSRYRKQA